MTPSLGWPFSGSTNPWQLFTAGHIEDALGPEGALEQHFRGWARVDATDATRARTSGVRPHERQGAFSFAFRHKCRKTAFAGDLQRVQTEDFARGANILADRNEGFLHEQFEIRSFIDFIKHAGQATTRQVAQAMNLDPCAKHL